MPSPQVQGKNRKKWLEALRSGLYSQGEGTLKQWSELKNRFEYCCLGVACEISGLGEWRESSNNNNILEYVIVDENGVTHVNREVLKSQLLKDHFGLRDQRGDFLIRGHATESSLATQNDNGQTFEQIADIIESKPDGLLQRKRK